MKLQGPMMSIGASGTYAGTITMATWKGRPYARQTVTPSNPKTAQQTSFRAMFAFLSQSWATLTDDAQSSWSDLAAQGNYSPFNAYMKFNQDRWGRGLAPMWTTSTAAGANGTVDTWSATAGVRSVTLNLKMDPYAQTWGNIIYMALGAPPTGALSEAIIVHWNQTNLLYHIPVLQLTTGEEYHFKTQPFTMGGLMGALSADVQANPT